MNHIGQRIKELRKKNDLTQEKLADFLGVTYQSVSKWECGTTMPDLALIVPLARVLHVSTDELLGIKPAEQDERKAYFDAEYHQFWKKDHEADLEIARQAAAEYPDDCRYLYWLASDEFYVGYSVENIGCDTERELLESAVKHYEMVLEHCNDQELRNHTVAGLTYVYNGLGRKEEAKKCAMLYSEDQETSRDELLLSCTDGEESEMLKKRMVKKALIKLCIALSQLWSYVPQPSIAAMDAEETIIKTVLSDGNYQHFHITLAILYEERAKIAMRGGEYNAAVSALSTAMNHAIAFDAVAASGKEQYTSPVLCGYIEDHANDRKEEGWSMTESVREFVQGDIFAPLHDREDFQAIWQ